MRVKNLLAAIILVSALIMLQAGEPTQVEEEITVLASKSETPLSQFGSSVQVVTEEDIEQHQWHSVAEILHFLPGVSMASAGSDGGLTSAFLRGANAEDTLVLVNGVKLNDASGVTRGFDFAHLSTAGIARLELVLGPQSALYGSDASAGVVNIVMKDGGPPQYHIDLEGSDSDSSALTLGANGGKGIMDYSLSLSQTNSEDLSARTVAPPNQGEEDGYSNLSGHFNMGLKVGESGRLQLGATYVDADSDLDAFNSDDPNFTGNYRQNTLSARYEGQPYEKWGYGLYLSRSQTDRDNRDQKDEAHPLDASESDFKGVNQSAEFRNTIKINEASRLVGGISFDKEEGEGATRGESAYGPYASNFSESADILGLFAQIRYGQETGFHGSLGGRFDDHSQFGSKTTGQVSAGYRFPTDTRLRAFYGTGYKAPSVYQLYSDFGNEALKEETSETLELGVSQFLFERKMQVGISWFDSQYQDRIDFGFNAEIGGFAYINVGDDTEMGGSEVFLSYLGAHIQSRFTYEKLDADLITTDFETGDPVKVPLLRRYENKASALFSGNYQSGLSWNLDFLWYGESSDTNFNTFTTETVDDYVLVNLGMAYKWGDHLTLRLRSENLTDEEYTQVIGYATHGRRIFLGLRYTL